MTNAIFTGAGNNSSNSATENNSIADRLPAGTFDNPNATTNTVQDRLPAWTFDNPAPAIWQGTEAENIANAPSFANSVWAGDPQGNAVDSTTVRDDINDVPWIKSKIDLEVIAEEKEAYEANKENEQKLEDIKDNTITDATEFAESEKQRVEEFYNAQNASIQSESDQIAEIEKQQEELYNQRIDRDTELLKIEKENNISLLNAQNERQRIENEETIRQAKTDVEISRQQSAWAYNKLWLGFSSWVINQSQQIATEWIAKIAEIKANASYQEATISNQIGTLEYQYSSDINATIDNYTDKITELQESAIARVEATNRNIRTNNNDKNSEIADIEKSVKDELKDLERQHIEDITNIKDKWIGYLQDIQASVADFREKEIAKLDVQVQNGTIVNLSPEQIAKYEKQLDLPAWTINAQLDTNINQRIRSEFDNFIGPDYLIENISSLSAEIKNEMKNWRSFEEATSIVIGRELSTNQAYKAKEEAKIAEAKAIEDKANLERDKFDEWVRQFDENLDYLKGRDEENNRIDNSKLSEQERQFNIENWVWTWDTWVWLKAWDTWNWYKVTQAFWDKSVNSKDTGANWWTPWNDIAIPKWTPINNFVWGTITSVTWGFDDWGVGNNDNFWYWNQVIITDKDWNQHIYSHLSKEGLEFLEEGWEVEAWASFWKSWNSWFSTWAHLDYRVKNKSWEWIDPWTFMGSQWGSDTTPDRYQEYLDANPWSSGLSRKDFNLRSEAWQAEAINERIIESELQAESIKEEQERQKIEEEKQTFLDWIKAKEISGEEFNEEETEYLTVERLKQDALALNIPERQIEGLTSSRLAKLIATEKDWSEEGKRLTEILLDFNIDDDEQFKDLFDTGKKAWFSASEMIEKTWAQEIEDPSEIKNNSKQLYYIKSTWKFWADEWTIWFNQSYKY